MLDFGLARALATEASASTAELSQSPTLTHRMTQAGMILGTAAYMSPEQARGREADRRADVWAFGAVVYEMLAGRRAFAGETISDTLASVMRDEPEWTALPPGLSPRWRRLLERCLAKDPRRRLQAIGEARIALEDLAANPEDSAQVVGAASGPTLARRAALIPWLLAAAAVVALAFTLWRKPPTSPTATEQSIVPAGGQRVAEDIGYLPLAIAPDGRTIAYTVRVGGVLKLRLRRLDTREHRIPARTGRGIALARRQWIGFFDLQDGSLGSWRHAGRTGGRARGPARHGSMMARSYSRASHGPLYRIPESGGAPIAITALDTANPADAPVPVRPGRRTQVSVHHADGGQPRQVRDAGIGAVNVRSGERRHLYKERGVLSGPGRIPRPGPGR